MRSFAFACALGLSLLFHAVLAAALALYFVHAPEPDAPPLLDMTSVDVSFAETVEETAAACDAAPPAALPPEASGPAPNAEPLLEARDPSEPPVPPEPDTVTQLEPPAEGREPMTPPEALSAAAAPRQARIDAPPCPQRRIRPDYPHRARQRGEQGDVTLEVDVGTDGLAAGAKIVLSCGFADLDAAALAAVLKARFTPAQSGGRPVAAPVRLTLKFRLW